MDGGGGTFRVGDGENDFDCSWGLFCLLPEEARKRWLKMVREGKTVHGKPIGTKRVDGASKRSPVRKKAKPKRDRG